MFASEHGLGTWVRRDLAIVDAVQVFIHGDYRANGWGPEPVPRAMQLMRVVDPGTGAGLSFGHLHGIRQPGGKGDTPERAVQAARIVAALDDFGAGDAPFVLAGDFNLLPQSETFARLRALGLRDLVTGSGLNDTRTALYTKPERHANYMWVSPHVRWRAFEAPATPAVSDHRALILDLVP